MDAKASMTPDHSAQPAEGVEALPKLPAPQKECWIGHQLFSAEQMRDYARATLATQPAARRVTEDPWVSELIAAAQGLADEQVYSDHDEPDYEPEDGKHNGPPAKARNKHQRAYWRLRAALESFAQPAEGVSGG